MSDEAIEVQITKADLVKTKRKYEYSAKVKTLKGLENLRYSDKELAVLGLIKKDLKPAMVEIVMRATHEINLRLKHDIKSVSTSELIGGSNLFAQRILDLDAQGQEQAPIDWAKFNLNEFENVPNKSEDSGK